MSARKRAPIPAPLRRAVIARDRGRCRYCGIVPTKRGPLHVDHVRPVFLGGLSDYDNLVVACGTCNGAKSSRADVVPMPLDELVAITEGRAPERPQVRRMQRSRYLDRDDLRVWAATGQRLAQRAQHDLIQRYPLGKDARCDHCHKEIIVGISGCLWPELATLVCTSCIRTRQVRRVRPTATAQPGSTVHCGVVSGV